MGQKSQERGARTYPTKLTLMAVQFTKSNVSYRYSHTLSHSVYYIFNNKYPNKTRKPQVTTTFNNQNSKFLEKRNDKAQSNNSEDQP